MTLLNTKDTTVIQVTKHERLLNMIIMDIWMMHYLRINGYLKRQKIIVSLILLDYSSKKFNSYGIRVLPAGWSLVHFLIAGSFVSHSHRWSVLGPMFSLLGPWSHPTFSLLVSSWSYVLIAGSLVPSHILTAGQFLVLCSHCWVLGPIPHSHCWSILDPMFSLLIAVSGFWIKQEDQNAALGLTLQGPWTVDPITYLSSGSVINF